MSTRTLYRRYLPRGLFGRSLLIIVTPMVLLQATVVGSIGYCLGIAMTAAFFELTKDNLDLAPGLYIFQVEAPGTPTHTGKLAVIK